MSNDIATQVNTNHGTLSPHLHSAVFRRLDTADAAKVSAGYTLQVLRKRGEKSRIKEALAIEVPAFTSQDVQLACQLYPALVDRFISTLYAEQREILFNLAGSDAADKIRVDYADITIGKIAEAINKTSAASAKLSKEAVVNWYNTSGVADVVAVVLAERLGLADKPDLSPAELDKITQVSAQVRDTLATLANPNARHEARVKASLQLMLDAIEASGIDDSGMVERLNARLNPAPASAKISLADALGL